MRNYKIFYILTSFNHYNITANSLDDAVKLAEEKGAKEFDGTGTQWELDAFTFENNYNDEDE